MIRRFALTFVLLAIATQAAGAQRSRVAPDSLTTRFVGVWDGRFVSDHATGGMQLTLSRDTAWKASIEMAHGDQAIPTLVTNVKVAGKTISWTQELMGMTCATSATVDGTAMAGEAACGQLNFKIDLQKK
jgi:hypothetical protein